MIEGRFQSGVVNVGGRNIDDLEEVTRKLKVVCCNVEELIILGHLVWSAHEYREMGQSEAKQTSCNQGINFSSAEIASLAAPMTLSTSNHARNPSCRKLRRMETIAVTSPLISIRWLYQYLQAYCSATLRRSWTFISRSSTSEFKA